MGKKCAQYFVSTDATDWLKIKGYFSSAKIEC